MEVIKKCPVCRKDCTLYKDNNLYILECPNCKKNGLTIRIENKNYDDLIKIWNNREADNFLMKYPRESITFIELLNGKQIDSDKVKEILKDFDYKKIELDVSSTLGYIEDLEGNIYSCTRSHIETLLSSLGIEMTIDYNQTSFDAIIQTVFTKRGYIKISTQAKCMMLEINYEKVNKKQIDSLIKFLSEDPKRFKDIKVYYIDLFDDEENCKIEVFYTLNDLILFLDKLN